MKLKSKSKKSEKKSESEKSAGTKHYFKTLFFADLLALFLIVLGSVLIYNIHTKLDAPIFDAKTLKISNVSLGDYPYPLHFDEYNHIAQAKQILEEGLSSKTNPQLYSGDPYVSMEKGFHILLAGISLITGVSLIRLALFLPAIFFGLGTLLIYLFFSCSLKKHVAGIFSILFLIFVPSNINVLGFWFLTPSCLTLIFIGGLLLLLYEVKRPRNIIFGGLLTFVSFFVYPVITVLLLLLFVVFAFFEYKFWDYLKSAEKWQKGIMSLGVILFLLILFFLRKKLIFEPRWTDFPIAQNILTYVLPVVIFLAIVGFFWLYVENKFLFSIVAIYSFFGILSTASYLMFEYGVIVPYQRMLFQWGILLSIAAGYGAYFMIVSFSRFLKKKFKKINILIVQVLFVVIFTVSILAIFLPSYYVVPSDMFAIQKIVHPEQVKLLNYINTSQPKAVLADPYFSVAIYPLSKNKAVATLNGNLGGGNYGSFYNSFMRNGSFCTERWNMVHEAQIDFIIINQKQYCEFMKELAVDGDYYLYMVIPELLPSNNYG